MVVQADGEGVAQGHVREGQHLVPHGRHVATLAAGGQAGGPSLTVDRDLHVAVDGVEAVQQVVLRRDVLALYHLQPSIRGWAGAVWKGELRDTLVVIQIVGSRRTLYTTSEKPKGNLFTKSVKPLGNLFLEGRIAESRTCSRIGAVGWRLRV